MTTHSVTDVFAIAQAIGMAKTQTQDSGDPFKCLLENTLQDTPEEPIAEESGQTTAAEEYQTVDVEQEQDGQAEIVLAAPMLTLQYIAQDLPVATEKPADYVAEKPAPTQAQYTSADEKPQVAQAAPENKTDAPVVTAPKPEITGYQGRQVSEEDLLNTKAPESYIKERVAQAQQAQPQATGGYEAIPGQAKFKQMVYQANLQLQDTAKTTEQPTVLPREIVNTQHQQEAPEVSHTGQEAEDVLKKVAVNTQPITLSEALQATNTAQAQAKPAAPETPAGQVSAEIAKGAETDRTEFEMQLRPHELGKVNVKMVMEGGALTVQIMAETGRAAAALQEQAAGLIASMRLAGIQVETVQIVQQPSASSEQMHHDAMFTGQGESGQDGQTGTGSGNTASDDGLTEEPASQSANQPERLLDTAV